MTLSGEVFRQQLIKLWPINVVWPYIVRLLPCKRPLPSSSDDASIITRRRYFENNRNPQLDMSLTLTKFHDDNDGFIS